MLSKVNPALEVTEDSWVVSLVRTGDHALVVVESVGYGAEPGHCLRWFDFLPKTTNHNARHSYGYFFVLLRNQETAGKVRICAANKGQPLIDIPPEISKNELFAKLNWHNKADSWVCAPDAVKTMIAAIYQDAERSQTDQLKFKYCGHRTPNCTTWALAKLKLAGIEAGHHHFQNKFYVRASKNIGYSR